MSLGRPMIIDHTLFFNEYRNTYGRMNPDTVAGLEMLITQIQSDPLIPNIPYAAYMLATVKHECANEWYPIIERGDHAYFNKYEAHTVLGRRLGNIDVGDGYLFRGRGYVQITGRGNYRRMTKLANLEVDLEKDPDHALRPTIAYQIMSIGMFNGVFTGKRLADYVHDDQINYRDARRVINGTDQAGLIARYAGELQHILDVSVARP